MSKLEDSDHAEAAALGENLRRAVGRFVRAVRADADTPRSAQSETLALLEREGSMNIASLAQLRNVKHQTMRVIIGQLESGGLVVRESDPADRRSQIITLSRAGSAVLIRDRADRASRIDVMIREQVSPQERVLLGQAIAILDRMSAATEP